MFSKMVRNLLLMIVVLSAFTACKKTDNQILRDEEKTLLTKYIDTFHKGIVPKQSGLYYIETKSGTGDSIVTGDYVKVYFEGYLIENNDTTGIKDGYLFDSSGRFEPFAFTVGAGAVISGWDEAITYMKEGGVAKWIIPSKLAYSSSGSGYIPAYATLVFYVTVYKVYNAKDDFKVIQKLKNLPLN